MNDLIDKMKRNPITFVIIGICVAVYIISVLLYGTTMNTDQAIEFNAYNPVCVLILNQYYRLLTANFIHFGLLHIVVNCYSFYGLGCFLETVFNKIEYITIILVSAIATTGLPFLLFLFNEFGTYTVSAGLSGVIFGLIGALGALSLKYRDIYLSIFKQLLPNILSLLVISFIVPSISWSGHVSGMIGGFVITYIIVLLRNKKLNRNPYKDLLN